MDACLCTGMFEAYDQDTKKLKAEKWRAQQRAEREARKPYWEKPPWLVGTPPTSLPYIPRHRRSWML